MGLTKEPIRNLRNQVTELNTKFEESEDGLGKLKREELPIATYQKLGGVTPDPETMEITPTGRLKAKSQGVGITSIEFTLEVSDWSEIDGINTGGIEDYFPVYADIEDERILTTQIPDVILSGECLTIAANAGIASVSETIEDGKVRIFAQRIPESDITGVCYLIGANGASPISEMPIATVDTVGGIKASDTVEVDDDGTARAKVSPDTISSDNDTVEMLDEVFGD